jgi:probable HAF family extracellular repeat protein
MFCFPSKVVKRSGVVSVAALLLGCSFDAEVEPTGVDESALRSSSSLSVSSWHSAASEAGDQAFFRVALAKRPRGIVTVTTRNEHFLQATASPASLTFRPNDWNVPQTITVSAVNDQEFDLDADVEIQLVGQGADSRFSGCLGAFAVRILDDDFKVIGYRARRLFETESRAVAINNRDQIALSIAGSAFLWDDGLLSDIGGLDPNQQSHALDINDDGVLLGWSDTAGGVVRFLHHEGQVNATEGEVWAINDRGHTVGDALYADGVRSELPDIGPAPAVGLGLSDEDAVTGSAAVEPFGRHAFYWDNGSFTDLGTFGGPVGEGLAINDAGHAVGRLFTPAFVNRPFLYGSGVLVDVGTVGPSPGGTAKSINNRGDMVGADEDAARMPQRGWVGRLGTLRELAPLIEEGCFHVVDPVDVNDAGVIAANALDCDSGTYRAYLLEPIKIAPDADPPSEDP